MLDPLSNLTLLSLIIFFGPKILIAAICGGIIGFEREVKHKSAGLTTMVLMSVGSALFVATTILLSNQQMLNHISPGGAVYDPARIIAQIISGIGFIGGGVIFKVSDKISGITTAAIIWTTCGVGILVGAGGGIFCILLSLVIVIMVFFIKLIEKKIIRKHDIS